MDEQLPLSEVEKRMHALKKQQLIEAALYLAGRPVQLPELVQVTGIESGEVGSLIRELQEKYK